MAASQIKPIPQNHDLATYTSKITPQTARLDWHKPATHLCNLIRAMNPFPGAWFALDEERVKVFKARAVEKNHGHPPGTIICQNPQDGLQIACADKSLLEVLELKKAGKARMQIRDFIHGCRFKAKVLA